MIAWKNNRKLTDPKEFERVKASYVVPRFVSDLPNEELLEIELAKERNKINQAK